MLAGTLGVNSGIMDDADLHDYRVRTVQSVLAQVRLRNSTEHLGSGVCAMREDETMADETMSEGVKLATICLGPSTAAGIEDITLEYAD